MSAPLVWLRWYILRDDAISFQRSSCCPTPGPSQGTQLVNRSDSRRSVLGFFFYPRHPRSNAPQKPCPLQAIGTTSGNFYFPTILPKKATDPWKPWTRENGFKSHGPMGPCRFHGSTALKAASRVHGFKSRLLMGPASHGSTKSDHPENLWGPDLTVIPCPPHPAAMASH